MHDYLLCMLIDISLILNRWQTDNSSLKLIKFNGQKIVLCKIIKIFNYVVTFEFFNCYISSFCFVIFVIYVNLLQGTVSNNYITPVINTPFLHLLLILRLNFSHSLN
jgi:hypothetical protein